MLLKCVLYVICTLSNIWPSAVTASLLAQRRNVMALTLYNQTSLYSTIEKGLGNTQGQAPELISGPSLGAKARFLSFNRTQPRAVNGLLTGHNTLRRHLHLLGLLDKGCN
jgi:hypothetical protein